MFNIVEDSWVVLKCGGHYYQCELYSRNNLLYAKFRGSYVLLMRHGTSVPKVTPDGYFNWTPCYNELGITLAHQGTANGKDRSKVSQRSANVHPR